MASDQPVFEIGITMAGAISAGAYSGGVFDFLCEALSEWEKLRAANPASVPNHHACIKVIAGASAGSVTGALASVALAKGMTSSTVPGKPGYRYNLAGLYQAWVTRIDLASDAPGGDDLLTVNDLKGADGIKALLNTQCIDAAAAAIVTAAPSGPALAYSWIGSPLHCYFSITNIRGVPYGIPFDSGSHVMMNHGDREHFTLRDLGCGPGDNSWCQTDDTVTLPYQELRSGTGPAISRYLNAALASSAFPIGLSARRVDMAASSYNLRNWTCIDLKNPRSLVPLWPTDFPMGPQTIVPFAASDGGIIDNEPFEYAHRGLLADGTTHNATDKDEATKAVIMIDPFPEPPDFQTDDKLACDGALIAIAKALFPLLKDQARFKPHEAELALDPRRYSRYLISPKRSDTQTSLSSAPLATSLLGGFGGFLDVSFREHDYQLGRRNCQRFLREHLAVGLRNPIAWDDASGHSFWGDGVYANKDFRDKENEHVVVIPLVGSAKAEVQAPAWPRISLTRAKEIEKRIAARLDVLTAKLFKDGIGASLFRGIVSLMWQHAYGRQAALDFIHWILIGQLVERDQLSDYAAISPAARSIAAAMSSSKCDYWSSEGLAALIKKTPAEALAALASLRSGPIPVWSGQVAGKTCHIWADKRPGWFARNVPGWSSPPKIDPR